MAALEDYRLSDIANFMEKCQTEILILVNIHISGYKYQYIPEYNCDKGEIIVVARGVGNR